MTPLLRLILVAAAAVAVVGGYAAASEARNSGENSSPRSGALHITKECSRYTGVAGSFCTITSSSLNAIKPGSRVIYASAADFRPDVLKLDSDLVIDGPGNDTAFGHVVLDLSTFTGVVTFSGGTGEFTHFHAGPLAVACPGFATVPVCSWDGPYSFSPPAAALFAARTTRAANPVQSDPIRARVVAPISLRPSKACPAFCVHTQLTSEAGAVLGARRRSGLGLTPTGRGARR